MKALLIAVLLLPSHTMAANEGNILKDLISQFEELATEFAQRMEELYQDRRCNATDIEACNEANYNGCISTLPGAACYATTELKIDVCGNCSSVFDFTASSVLLPERTVSNSDGTMSLSKEVSPRRLSTKQAILMP
jgi:hypothetical protein